ncbi:LamG domain-containing protein, partial [bacterium]|nr:LamG domain-containing protein [bacterium]
ALGHWSFDEGYGDTANDSGTGGNNGDLAGSCPGAATCPTWTNSGKFGKALSFDGNDYVDAGTNLDINGELTISAWIKPDVDTGGPHMIVGNDGTAVGDYALEINRTAGRVSAYWGNQVIITSDSSINTTDWQHVTLVRKGSTSDWTAEIYIDGILDKTATTSVNTTGTNETTAIGVAGSSGAYDFEGDIDEVKIYNSALTQDQIKLLYNQTSAAVWGTTSTDLSGVGTWSSANEYCPPGQGSSCTAPVGEWKFDEKTNTSAYDTSENNNTGTLTNGPEWRHAGECKHGSCLFFDGASGLDQDDNVAAGSDTSIDDIFDGGGSASFWVYPQSANELNGRMLAKIGVDSGWRIQVQTCDSNNLDLRMVTDVPGTGSQWRLDCGLTIDEWNHVAITYNDDSSSNDPTFYVNGIKQTLDLDINGDAYVSDASDNFIIGADSSSGTGTFDGLIDEVKVYDYVRTQAQIAWDYNRGAPIGHWQLDECTEDTAYDIGSGGNNGTITIGGSGSNTSAGTCSSGDTSHAWYNGITGKVNSSLNFDGNDDYISIGDDSALDLDNGYSVTAWVNFDDVATNYQTVVVKPQDANNANYWLGVYTTDGELECGHADSGSFYTLNTTTANLSTGQWYHLVCIHDASAQTITIYVNGVQKAHQTAVNVPDLNDQAVQIGDDSTAWGGTNLDGQIDDVRIYNYALTPQQIRNEFNQGAVYFGPNTGSP